MFSPGLTTTTFHGNGKKSTVTIFSGTNEEVFDHQMEDSISKLIDQLFITEEDIDLAFGLAKKIKSSVHLHFILSDVCNAYLKLGTEEGCKKAYTVAKFKENKRDDVRKLYDSIIEVCVRIKTVNSIALAEQIYEDNAECLSLSLHRNEFHMAKAQVEQGCKREVKLANDRSADVKGLTSAQKGQEVAKASKVSLSSDDNRPVAVTLQTPKSDSQEAAKASEVSLSSNEEIKQSIFSLLKSGELEVLRSKLAFLDPLQKSKYLSSTMKFHTPWAGEEEEMTPLQYACFLGKIEGVRLLIECGVSVNDFRSTSDSTQRGSLHFAIDANHPAIALLLISNGAKDRLASCHTFYGFKQYQLPPEFSGSWTCLSALHMAIIKNMHDVVRELLKSGNTKVLEKASGINSPLHLAARGGDIDMVRLLLASGANATLSLKDSCGRTPKEVAGSKKHDLILTLLS